MKNLINTQNNRLIEVIMSLIISCSGAKHIAKKIANKAKAEYSELQIKKFPDNELDIKFLKNLKNKEIILVQSFYQNINEKIIETLFAAYTAKDLGAKKVNLIALYFPYLRKDKRFKPGECISAKVMVKLFSIFNKILIVEPHLHRIKKLKKLFPNAKKIEVSKEIATYLKKRNIQNPIYLGPDIESKQWVSKVTKHLKAKPVVLRKIRYSSRKVKIKIPKKIKIENKNIIIIDDIISTGHTMLQTIKTIKKFKPKKIYCICIHGIFAENSLSKLKKYSEVISCNTIPSPVSKIDITNSIE
jgi:ribose-phosphate pyrophosphokinase